MGTKLKRCGGLLLAMLLLAGLYACGGGDVSKVQIEIRSAELYSEQEVMDAMDIVIDHFEEELAGCTMNSLVYNERLSANELSDWAEQYHADEAIVLESNFDTDPERTYPTLESGTNYVWKWILTRSNGGRWELQTWGYG